MAATPFRPALDLMSQYAEYHRDRRNIVTHFLGIPLIVFAIGILLARVSIGGFTLAWIAWALSTAWYLTRGNLVLGVATSVVNGGVSRIRPGTKAELIAQNIPNPASMCYDSGANQLVIPMNANNAMAFIPLK